MMTSLLAAATLALLPGLAPQDPGALGRMWTFESPPLDRIEQERGVRLTPAWVERMQHGTLSVENGGSAAFVSPDGLILTNHHILRSAIRALPSGDAILRDGFSASERDREIRLEGLAMRQLVDVVELDATRDVDPQLDTLRERHPDHEVVLVKLFGGARLRAYRFRRFDDLRLVCSPHLQVSHFGGDLDNFSFPRYCLDFTFVRAWEDGRPFDASRCAFKWSESPVRSGDVVFAAGAPSVTQRARTLAQLEFYRDVWHPLVLGVFDDKIAVRRKLLEGCKDAEQRHPLEEKLARWENARKAYRGYQAGLLDERRMNEKAAAEAALRHQVSSSVTLQSLGDVWAELESVVAQRRQLEPRLRLQTDGWHPTLAMCLAILELRDEGLTDEDREHVTSRIETYRAAVLQRNAVDRLDFEKHLSRAETWLGRDDPWIQVILKDRSPAEVASLLSEVTFDGITPSNEIVLRWAEALRVLRQQNREQHLALRRAEDQLQARLAETLLAVHGETISAEATGTPRFSDGVVRGYERNGSRVSFKTSLFGLFAKHSEFDGRPPFDLPAVWIERHDQFSRRTALDLVSTNDVAPGSSGSALLNVRLEVVGLVFDGNAGMLANRFLYRSDTPRAISVHADAILETLRVIYEAEDLIDELLRR